MHLIVFLSPVGLYHRAEDNPNRGLAVVIIGKQRNGPTGMIKMTFLGEYTTFENYTNRMPASPYQPELDLASEADFH